MNDIAVTLKWQKCHFISDVLSLYRNHQIFQCKSEDLVYEKM